MTNDQVQGKDAKHSTAMAQTFNAEIVHFPCGIADHALFSTSLKSAKATCACRAVPHHLTDIIALH